MTMPMFNIDNQSNEQKLYISQNILNHVKMNFYNFLQFRPQLIVNK
jgi:hypothetical protein